MSMLVKMPRKLPPLDVLLEDLFRPHPTELAKALGVGERTVRRWIAENEAPRPVLLALFWLSRWGMQWMDADLYNEAQLHFSMNRCQAAEMREMRKRMDRMARIGNFGAANDPNEHAALPLARHEKPVHLHLKKRAAHPAQGRGGRRDSYMEVPVIRERVCKPPTGFHHFIRKKRAAA